MRSITKPSTACCNVDMYVSYLLSDPLNTNCTRMADVMENISHDSVNRFLNRENFTAKDLFDEEKSDIDLVNGTLSIDDSVLDKPYSDPKKAALIDMFWSGKHKRVVKGINLITLYHTDVNGVSVPVNFRLYNKSENKTKNDHFIEMLNEVIEWGISPAWVTGDSWYSSLQNLKYIRKKNLNFMFAIENNRLISIERGQYIQIQTLEDWSNNENTVYLKDYGLVKVFRQIYKKMYRYYIMSTFDLENLSSISYANFESVHAFHWGIEQFHRAVKQVCNIEKFQVRNELPIRNHIFCAIKGFVNLELMRAQNVIAHWYEVKRDLFLEIIRNYVLNNSSPTTGAVNA